MKEYYDMIKDILKNKIRKLKNNRSDLENYYKVGELLIEDRNTKRVKHENELIKEYSRILTSELGKNYSVHNPKNIRKIHLKVRKSPPFRTNKITWSNLCELLKFEDIDKFEYYLKLSFNLTTREYERKKLVLIHKLINVTAEPVVLSNLKFTENRNNKKGGSRVTLSETTVLQPFKNTSLNDDNIPNISTNIKQSIPPSKLINTQKTIIIYPK